jgi:hypothetical protein
VNEVLCGDSNRAVGRSATSPENPPRKTNDPVSGG